MDVWGLTWMVAVLFTFDRGIGRTGHCDDFFKH